MTARVLMAIDSEDLRNRTLAVFGELGDYVEVVGTVETSNDLLLAVESQTELDVIVVDDRIGPLPCLALVRELMVRVPDLAILVISQEASINTYQAVMDAGGRAVLESPPTLEDLAGRLPGILDWQRQLRAHSGARLTNLDQPGRLVAFVGAKGGVGTSTIALHAALLAAVGNPDRRVCLIDFDLQQRGLRHLIDVKAKRTVVDLVGISDALTGRNLDEATIVHRSGLRLLMAPEHGEQADELTSAVTRHIVGATKGAYDLIVVDCGSVVTDATAVAMEFSDDLLMVATPDVAAIRGAQDKLDLLARLQVIKPGDGRLLFNKVNPRHEVQPEFGARMTNAEPLATTFAEDWKRLEGAANALAPLDVEDGPFRRSVLALGRELRLRPERPEPARQLAEAADAGRHGPHGSHGSQGAGENQGGRRGRRRGRSPKPPRGSRGRRGERDPQAPQGQQGQSTPEAAAGLAAAILIFFVLLQVIVLSVGAISSRRAADAAALAATRGGSAGEASAAARRAVPGMFDVSVSRVDADTYRAVVTGPTIIPGLSRPMDAEGSAAQEED